MIPGKSWFGSVGLRAGRFAALPLLLGGSGATSNLEAAPRADDDPKPLTHLTLEELAGLKVVTLSKREESSVEAPGAVRVITSEDIRRTGSISLQDALRTAPGVQAARIDADEWALAIRGFSSRLSRSILALVDGRSVWTPLFAGVFWGTQDTLLEDVEQIEVSRGPGGATYGANAMNGVIAITTRSAKDTQGGLVSLAAGSADYGFGARFGSQAGENLFYRGFAKYALRDGTKPLTAAGYDDAWKFGTGGFRMDWERSTRDILTVAGNLYDGRSIQPSTTASFTPPFARTLSGEAHYTGANLLGRFTRDLARGGSVRAQAYYARTDRREVAYRENRDTVDFEFQHRQPWRARHDVVWGASYRRSGGDFPGTPVLRFVPPQRTDDLFGVFANNETRFLHDRVRVSLGAKLEWNDYSGWNAQPSGRIAWARSRHLFWGAWTRAIRTSSRLEEGVVLYSPSSATEPIFVRTRGSEDFNPENVTAFEAGYKLRLPRLLLSASAFRNAYHDLAASLPDGAPFVEGGGAEPLRTVTPIRIGNGPGGRTTGVEAEVVGSIRPSWRVQASFSWLRVRLDGEARRTIPANSPKAQFWLTSFWSPRPSVDVDIVFRSIGALDGQRVPGFSELDARIGYRLNKRLELSATGANLLSASHAEFGGGFAVERSLRLQALVRF